MHKNFLRFYNKKNEYRIYFITIVTKDRIQFFDEQILKKMFKDILIIAKYFHDFYLYTFTIQKDHIHLLIQPLDDKNISQIIKFIKQNSTQNINSLSTQQIVGADSHPCRNNNNISHRINPRYTPKQNWIIKKYRNYLSQLRQYINLEIQHFQWQKSFHDHIIRNYKEFKSYSLYIENNSNKHERNKDI